MGKRDRPSSASGRIETVPRYSDSLLFSVCLSLYFSLLRDQGRHQSNLLLSDIIIVFSIHDMSWICVEDVVEMVFAMPFVVSKQILRAMNV